MDLANTPAAAPPEGENDQFTMAAVHHGRTADEVLPLNFTEYDPNGFRAMVGQFAGWVKIVSGKSLHLFDFIVFSVLVNTDKP